MRNSIKVLEQNIAQTLLSHLHDKLVKVEKELETIQHSLTRLSQLNKDYNDVAGDISKRREKKQQLQLEISEENNGSERMK